MPSPAHPVIRPPGADAHPMQSAAGTSRPSAGPRTERGHKGHPQARASTGRPYPPT
ncbi:hypothetical protein GCM10009535_21410 [Streptomyces thermocarboxydovorans]|uniref:Uncharacterized protein n=1 Tax=Streptomyces thermocarboxydovorans TaxID=59298 RepID=A0ABP3SLC7_9ACTN